LTYIISVIDMLSDVPKDSHLPCTYFHRTGNWQVTGSHVCVVADVLILNILAFIKFNRNLFIYLFILSFIC